MSSLQWSLLILAAVLIALVIGHNIWQNRKVQQRIEKSREGMANLMAQQREADAHQQKVQEGNKPAILQRFTPEDIPAPASPDIPGAGLAGPALDMDDDTVPLPVASQPSQASQLASNSHEANSQANNGQPTLLREVQFEELQKGNVTAAPAAQVMPSAISSDAWSGRNFGLNALADCIVEIPLQQLVSGEQLHTLIGSSRRVGNKPVIYEGRIVGRQDYSPIVAGERYDQLRMGVLLANRHGPMNALEYSDFAQAAQRLAGHFKNHVNLPDSQVVMQLARNLDQQCAQLDAQIGLSVLTPEALAPSQLEPVAQEFGLKSLTNNRFARVGPAGEVLYTLALGDDAKRLEFLLDVPRAPQAALPWEYLVECAQRMAARFGGRMVDDFDKPVTAEQLARIGEQLAQRYKSLSQAGFDAGSPLALRVFN